MTLAEDKSFQEQLQCSKAKNDTNALFPRSFFEKIRIIFSNVTVEPIIILYLIPSVMSIITTQNLNLEKGCRVNLKFSSEICDGLAARNSSAYNATDEAAVQKLVASMYVWKSIVQSFVPAVLLMFLGSWSDRHKRRKPCIILPIFGDCISCVGFLLCTYFFYELPMEYSVLSDTIPPAIFGGWFIMNMAAFSYISENSNTETRTIRVGAVSLFCNISMPIGLAVSGILYNTIGFYGVFSLSLAMLLAGAVYGFIRIKDKPFDGQMVRNRKKVGFFRDFFDTKHISETLQVTFKKGGKNRKKKVCLIMIVLLVVVGPFHGEFSVLYLSVRYRFQWNEIDYSLYCTYNFILQTIGTLFSLAFFSKFLKINDALLGAISSTSKFLACFIYAFAPNSTIFYVATVVEMLNGTSFIAMRSIISKLGPAEEIGKLNSLFGVCEAFVPLVYGTIYSLVYKMTITFLPGTFFLLGGALTLPAILIFIWLYVKHKQDLIEEERNKKQKEELLNKVSSLQEQVL